MSEEAICICEKHDFYDFFPNNEKTKCPCCEVEHLTEQLNSKQDALSAALLALDNAVERCVGLEAELDRYKEALEILSSIYFYGNFKPETYNESLLEQMLTQFGLWPTTEDEIIKRSIAREVLKEVE